MRCSRGSPGMPLKSVTTKVLDRHCPPYLSTRNGGSGELNVLGLDLGNSSKQIHIRRTVISRNLGQNPYFTELNAWRNWPSVDEEQFLREKTGGPLWARGRPRESSRSLFQGVGFRAPVSPASASPSDFPSDWLGSRAAVSPASALPGDAAAEVAALPGDDPLGDVRPSTAPAEAPRAPALRPPALALDSGASSQARPTSRGATASLTGLRTRVPFEQALACGWWSGQREAHHD